MERMSKKIRWGVLSTANIGVKKVIPGMQLGEFSAVTAIASRGIAKARAAADELGIEKAYGSYEELLADPDVDAIYNPLPNQLHVPWTAKAAEAGKHVLCEKPLSLTVAEAETLLEVRARTGVKIGEAFMIRSFTQWLRLRELLNAGRIGQLRSVVAAFSYYNVDPANIRNMVESGGGALYDIGCYCIQAARCGFGGCRGVPWGSSSAIRRCTRIGSRRPCWTSTAARRSSPAARSWFRISECISGDQGTHRNRDSVQRAQRQADAAVH